MPAAALQLSFSSFFITAGKPNLGFVLTILSGATNIFLDYLLIVKIPMGISGAAWGTAIGYLVAAVPGSALLLLQRKGTIFL
mgnify:FL=1